MKRFIALLFVLIAVQGMAQPVRRIYLFPGQGSDGRIFDSLRLSPQFDVCVIEYPMPEKNMTMQEFAVTLVPLIDTSQPYSFIGVSMGGMLCVELSEILKPEMTILISSAQTAQDLPYRYRFQKKVPVYKIFPSRWIWAGAQFLQPLVEPDRNVQKEVFTSMLQHKHPDYMKRTVEMIVKWERTTSKANIYQIHGSHDHTIPVRNLHSVYYNIPGGSHMITLTRAAEVRTAILEILSCSSSLSNEESSVE